MVKVFDSAEALIPALADHIRSEARKAVAARGRFTLALSGGSSPKTLYTTLAKDPEFPWSQTEVCLVDERFVPVGDKAHNGTMILAALGLGSESRGSLVARERVHLIPTHHSEPVLAAQTYSRDLEKLFGAKSPLFDYILLGMGADGHTASLFPDTGAVAIHDRSVTVVQPKVAPHTRISLTLPVLNAARSVAFLITGADKAGPLRSVVEDSPCPHPAGQVKPASLIFFVDSLAAAQLSKAQVV